MSPKDAAQAIVEVTPQACTQINEFARETLTVRGGRVGSGMGTLLEALWGYYVNRELDAPPRNCLPYEIAWLADNEYNDFAVVTRDTEWISSTKSGELLRVEAKSMNIQADESKGHFDQLAQHFDEWDLLLVLVWRWERLERDRCSPQIVDHFVGPALGVAELRDALHLARGGSFVDRAICADRCRTTDCTHHGEPLNAKGKRERLTGPKSLRPSSNVSFAANFGGLVRMLKTNSPAARATFRELRRGSKVAHEYISFIHRNYPAEERNQYTVGEWREIAAKNGISLAGLSREGLVDRVCARVPNYQDLLKTLR